MMKQLIELNQWDNIKFKDMSFMFRFTSNMIGKYTDSPDTSEVENMHNMFDGAKSFDQPVNHFNTAIVVNMALMFKNAKAFNRSIENFDTSNVKT